MKKILFIIFIILAIFGVFFITKENKHKNPPQTKITEKNIQKDEPNTTTYSNGKMSISIRVDKTTNPESLIAKGENFNKRFFYLDTKSYNHGVFKTKDESYTLFDYGDQIVIEETQSQRLFFDGILK